MMTQAAIGRDANYVPIQGNNAFLTIAPIVFDQTTTGAAGIHVLFTITGDVILSIFGMVKEALVDTGSGATISVGDADTTDSILPGSAIISSGGNNIYNSSGFQNVISQIDSDLADNSVNVIYDITGDDIISGTIIFYCTWRPLSQDGNVTVV